MLDKLPKNMSVVELGVFKGEFATELYKRLSPLQLLLVDIWCGESGSGDKDGYNHITVKDMERVYIELVDKYKSLNEVKLIRETTTNFLQSQVDSAFDMIYVDADHSYEAVTNDLQLSFKKLKNGGVLAGHDYIQYSQIAAAVDNFCRQYGQQIIAVTKDGCPTVVRRLSDVCYTD